MDKLSTGHEITTVLIFHLTTQHKQEKLFQQNKINQCLLYRIFQAKPSCNNTEVNRNKTRKNKKERKQNEKQMKELKIPTVS